jgi:redox-sensitive bicupin YhaK (pirin superfamily)
MSRMPAHEPVAATPSSTGIALALDARARQLGDGLTVRRLLPSAARRMVGPFVFFDHLGPVALAPGQGVDVPPHPHIGLATVTYLFDGELVHRDSLGSQVAIRPGDINWMVAGRGIVHSERSGPEPRRTGARLHGLQLWVALPEADEDAEPTFHHHPASTLPRVDREGVSIRVLAGEAYGVSSPVRTQSPLFYADLVVPGGCAVPIPSGHQERAVYLVEGELHGEGGRATPERVGPARMLVLEPGARPRLQAASDSRLVVLGGAPLEGPRHIWWNFVASSRQRIERAKRAWQDGEFPSVPGDEHERMPAPE